MPILWACLVLLLVYAPFPTQRRYLLGLQSALGVLAAWGWIRIIMPWFGVRQWVATIGFVGSAMISLMMLLSLNLLGLNPTDHPEQYIPSDVLTTSAWIRDHVPPESHILTVLNGQGGGNGGYIVWLTGRTVSLGHWVETANFAPKVQAIMNFYALPTSDDERRALLQEYGIDVIWYDQEAINLGSWSPKDADYLELIFSTPTIQLYAPK
jgi:hypothetical protein